MSFSLTGRSWGSIVIVFGLLGLFFWLLLPVFIPLAMGGVFAVMMYPLMLRLEARKWGNLGAATLLTLSLTLMIIIPTTVLLFVVIRAALSRAAALKTLAGDLGHSSWSETADKLGLTPWIDRLSQWVPELNPEEVLGALKDLVGVVGVNLVNVFGGLLTQLPALALGAGMTAIGVFFFLYDGKRLAAWAKRQRFLNTRANGEMVKTFTGLCRAVILAALLSGLVQTILYSISIWIAGVYHSIMVVLIVFFSTFVPLVGAAPVTFGLALWNLLNGNTTAGVILLVGASLAALSDNFVRPMVLKDGASLHPLVAFVSAFGGLQIFGFTGIFLGPITAGLAMKALELWEETRQ